MDGYKFQKRVHVTLAGTVLETSTKDINSSLDTIKFRMQPWSKSNFLALLKMLRREDEMEVMAIVERFPTLDSLTTNARCAYFLADSMPNITFANAQRWAGYVDVSVANVARRYTKSNGLSILSNMNEKFTVVQEAFKALDEALCHPSDARFPNFDHIKDKALRFVTQSLLDINVDIRNKVPTLTTGKYSVSMTPAITVVLAELLCVKALICWNWQDFETTAALGERKRTVAEMKLADFTDECGIIQLRSPVPETNAQKRFTIPVVGRLTVLVNGPAAPYADVISPFRLVQAKFSADTEEVVKLDFTKEMGKMGLTTDANFTLQQAVSSAFYAMWQQKARKSATEKLLSKVASLGYRKDERCKHYPYQTLLSGNIVAQDEISFIVDFDNGIMAVDEKRKNMIHPPHNFGSL